MVKHSTKPIPKRSFEQLLRQRFCIRLHMTLILCLVIVSGVVSSKLMLELGLRWMLPRYLIAVVASYLLFLVLIRLWLWYVSENRAEGLRPGKQSEWDLVSNIPFGRAATRGASRAESFGGGAKFMGGGAGGTWENSSRAAVASFEGTSESTKYSTRIAGKVGDIFDWDAGIVLTAFALLVLTVIGVGSYLVYTAPTLLTEIAFEAVLASGLVNATRQIHSLGWVGSVFKATRLPLLLVLAMTLMFGLVSWHYCPKATKISEVVTKCD